MKLTNITIIYMRTYVFQGHLSIRKPLRAFIVAYITKGYTSHDI